MTPEPTSDPDSTEVPSFESMLAELDRTIHALESGDLDLAAALRQYGRGVQLITRCRDLLDQAEQHVALLTGIDAEGNPTTTPFPTDPTPNPETSVPTPPRRS